MDLDKWIKEKGWSKTEFAKRVGVARATVYLWLNGKTPSKYALKRLEEVSGGKVKFKTINKT